MDNFKLSEIFNGVESTSKINDDVKVLDTDWVASKFLIPDDDVVDEYKNKRYNSTATFKFTSTSIGGNIGINPRPQYTRYADIRAKQFKRNLEVTTKELNSVGIGMGRYYSEALDDNAETIFLTFGVAEFSGLFNFFLSSIDYEESVIANTGRSPVAYNVGKLVGKGLLLAAFPLVTLTLWSLGTVARLFLHSNRYDYYYLRPTMANYWGTVNTIMSQIATEIGILLPIMMKPKDGKIGRPIKFNQEHIAKLNKLMPGVINETTNYIDVFKIATRAQALANEQAKYDREEYLRDLETNGTFLDYVRKRYLSTSPDEPGSGLSAALNDAVRLENLIDAPNNLLEYGKNFIEWLSTDEIKDELNIKDKKLKKPAAAKLDNESISKAEKEKLSTDKYKKDEYGMYDDDVTPDQVSYARKLARAADSAVRDGGLHATFYVDYTGSVSESFNNSTGRIETDGTLKQISQKARNIKFDLAGGDLTGNMDKAISATKTVVAGLLNEVTFNLGNIVQSLSGGGFIDLPLKWEDSSMSLPTITYNIQLRSVYGNVYSQMKNLYIPLSMLLAGALPISTGKSSYTSPYLCKLFNKGKQTIELGMITSLSITRGTSNLGWSKNKKPLAIDVSFTVTDFSTLIAVPTAGSIFTTFSPTIDDTSTMGRYLATLGSRDLLTSKYAYARARLRIANTAKGLNQMFTSSKIGMVIGENISGIIGGFASGHSLSLQYQN